MFFPTKTDICPISLLEEKAVFHREKDEKRQEQMPGAFAGLHEMPAMSIFLAFKKGHIKK
ncbi:MAG: hypothetical protein NC344_00960 [Bacteroidales bacterium]|nr:hypothetical protein [Bacteroidales bacterium]MCM1205155.1 hypothetical protein [Bacillota bacterium]MCM1509402.1 hypothetical protein [Clostridium sp.]